MASKGAKVLSTSTWEFSYLPSSSPVSSSTSEHEVKLILTTLTGKNIPCVAGFGNPCSCRTKGPKLPNWMIDNPLV